MITKLELIEYLKHTPENTNYNILYSSLYNGSNKEAVDEFIEVLSRGNLSLAALQPYLAKLYEDDKTISPEPLPPFSVDKLPNQNPLTFTGAVTGIYDGSEALTVEIPSGSGGVQPDWNQNDDTKPDYVKNRPFYAGDPVETVFVEERTETFEDAGGGEYIAGFESTFRPTDGDIYTVYWDGTVYECACVEDLDADDQPMYRIGNLSIFDSGSDTGEPFIFEIYNDGFISISTKDTSASHTFSISRILVEIVKIPTKYLPVASEIEPGIMSVNDMLQQVEDKYFAGTDTQVSGYYNAAIIKEYADYNNSYRIHSPGNFGGTVLSCYNDAINQNIKFVLSGSKNIECWKASQSAPHLEQLWGIYKDGVVISSSTTGSTKKFKITVDDGGTITATEVT